MKLSRLIGAQDGNESFGERVLDVDLTEISRVVPKQRVNVVGMLFAQGCQESCGVNQTAE